MKNESADKVGRHQCKAAGWRIMATALALCLALVALAPGALAEEEKELNLDKSLSGIKFSILGYVDYSSGQAPLAGGEEMNYNRFALTRGYFTVKKSITDWMGMRVTMDISQETKDKAESLSGSYVVRLKYLYADLKPGDLGFLTNMNSEIGLGHIPWLDFEEHINPYRCQGAMAIERAHVLNSADLGAGIQGFFGGKLEDAEQKTGTHAYIGRYGSWHFGVYNGSGYHATENNQNKVIEGRVTIRPLPDFAPGLQISYFGVYGEGNTYSAVAKEWPDYVVNMVMISIEHPAGIFTAQYFTTTGNASGAWLDKHGHALETAGWSVFGNLNFPGTDGKAAVFARYDWFDADVDDKVADETAYGMTVAGLAFKVYKHNLLLLVWESTDYEDDNAGMGKTPAKNTMLGNDDKVQAVWQIEF